MKISHPHDEWQIDKWDENDKTLDGWNILIRWNIPIMDEKDSTWMKILKSQNPKKWKKKKKKLKTWVSLELIAMVTGSSKFPWLPFFSPPHFLLFLPLFLLLLFLLSRALTTLIMTTVRRGAPHPFLVLLLCRLLMTTMTTKGWTKTTGGTWVCPTPLSITFAT